MKNRVQFVPVRRVIDKMLRSMKEPPLEKAAGATEAAKAVETAEVLTEEETAPFDLLRKGGLRVLAGRPGMGKTAFALQAAAACARRGEKVFFITVKDTFEKLVSYMAKTNDMPHFFTPGALPCAAPRSGDRESVRRALAEISVLPVFMGRADRASLPELIARVPVGAALIFDGMQDLFSMYAKPGAYAMTEKAVLEGARRASSVLVTVGVKLTLERHAEKVPHPGDLRCTAAFRSSAETVYTLYRVGYYACNSDPTSLLRAYCRDGKTEDRPLLFLRYDRR